jgi:hypothetical protein
MVGLKGSPRTRVLASIIILLNMCLGMLVLAKWTAGAAAAPAVARSGFPSQSGFPKTLHGEVRTSAVVADTDDDGEDELLFGSTTDSLWLIDGEGSTIATFDAHADVVLTPGVGDIDCDGGLEIACAAGDSIFCLSAEDLDREWSTFIEGTRTSVAIADLLGGDARQEIVLGSYHVPQGERDDHDCVTVLEHDGSDTLWERALDSQSNAELSAPAIGDVDKDGRLDVVIGSGPISSASGRSRLYAYRGTDGDPLWRVYVGNVPMGVQPPTLCSPVIGDMDSDDAMEVVVGSDQVYCRSGSDGSPEWSHDTWGDIAGLAIEDVDGDGELEIIATASGEPDSSHTDSGELYVLEGSGVIKCSRTLAEAPHTAPCLVDLDDDGQWEAIFGADNDTVGHLCAYTIAAGDSIVLYGKGTLSGVTRSSPAVTNADGDSYAEIFIGANDGEVYGFESQDSPAEARWVMFQKNARHTGRYRQVYSGAIPEDVSLWDDYLFTGDVSVPDSLALRIEPGTLVRAQAGSDDTSGGRDTTLTELRISGRLLASAADNQRINLGATADTSRSWYGIEFLSDSAGTLRYCDIGDAYIGVRISGSGTSRLLKHVHVDDSYLHGIHCSGTDGLTRISRCSVTSSYHSSGAAYEGTGIWLSGAAAVVESTEVRDFGNDGVFSEYDEGSSISYSKISSSVTYAPDTNVEFYYPVAGPQISFNEIYESVGIKWTSALADTATCHIWCNTIADSNETQKSRGMEFHNGRGGAVRLNWIEGKYILVYVESRNRSIYPDLGDISVSWGNNNLLYPDGYCFYNEDS